MLFLVNFVIILQFFIFTLDLRDISSSLIYCSLIPQSLIFNRDRVDLYLYGTITLWNLSLISRELYIPNHHITLYSFCEVNFILCTTQRTPPPWFNYKTPTKGDTPVYDLLHVYINFITIKWPRLQCVLCVESGFGEEIELWGKVEREEHQLTEADYSDGHFSYIWTVFQ